MENSFHSKASKNFVLKSDFLNNTANSKRNSKKNLSFYDQNQNGGNQKSLFRVSVSFADQENDENKKDRIKSNNMPEKELDTNLFNNNILIRLMKIIIGIKIEIIIIVILFKNITKMLKMNFLITNLII